MERVERAVRAAVRVASWHGVRATEPVVLRDRANLLVHLAPAPVVARIPGMTAPVRADPQDWLAREVAVAGFAAAAGRPSCRPRASCRRAAPPRRAVDHVLPLRARSVDATRPRRRDLRQRTCASSTRRWPATRVSSPA